MKNFIFWMAHAALIMWFVGLKILGLGIYSYLFLGNAILLYIIGSLFNANKIEKLAYEGEEIQTGSMTESEKQNTSGLVIWRATCMDRIHYWNRQKQMFVLSSECTSHEPHTLVDYEHAALHARFIKTPGMLYFLHDGEFFPKDKSILN